MVHDLGNNRVRLAIDNKKGNYVMKLQLSLLFAVIAFLAGADAFARNTIHEYDIADVLNNEEYASRLSGVAYYFGDQEYPAVAQKFGEYRTNKKTNAFNKSDLAACQWVMLSAMLQLRQRAQELGADAVVNIRSNYKNNVVSSSTKYTCGAGGTVAGVAFIGDFVKLK